MTVQKRVFGALALVLLCVSACGGGTLQTLVETATPAGMSVVTPGGDTPATATSSIPAEAVASAPSEVVVTATPGPPWTPAPGSVTYRVEAGETLFSIARQHGIIVDV